MTKRPTKPAPAPAPISSPFARILAAESAAYLDLATATCADVDAAGLSFAAVMADPLGRAMTLRVLRAYSLSHRLARDSSQLAGLEDALE